MAKKQIVPPAQTKPVAPAAQPTQLHNRNLGPAAAIIKEFEGCKLKAYRDSTGIPTIGWGSTKGVRMGMTITQAQADTAFTADLMEHMIPVQRALKVPVNDNEFGALTSLCYNIGAGNFAKSQVLKLLNQGQPKETVAQAFMGWTKAGGRVIPGLVRRRTEEKKLFLTPEPDTTLS